MAIFRDQLGRLINSTSGIFDDGASVLMGGIVGSSLASIGNDMIPGEAHDIDPRLALLAGAGLASVPIIRRRLAGQRAKTPTATSTIVPE